MNTQQLDQEIAVAAEARNQREERVLALLAAHSELNAAELARELAVAPTTMRETLKRMLEAGEVVRAGNLYSIPDVESEDEDETVTVTLGAPDDTVILPATATTVTKGDRNAEAEARDQFVLEHLAKNEAGTLQQIADALGVEVKTAYGSIWRLTHRENGESPKVAIVGRSGRKPLWGLAV